MTDDKEIISRNKLIKRQAVAGDAVCALYLGFVAENHLAGGGAAWIETQIDYDEENEDDEFRPY